MIKIRQRLKKNHHYVHHDEMELDALDRDGGPQTIYLDVDLRMSNTWDKVGREVTTAPFEVTYQFDGMRVNRVLHGLETGQKIFKEDRWTKMNDEQSEEERRIEQIPSTTEAVQIPEGTEATSAEGDMAGEDTQEARREQMKALEKSI